MSNSLGWVFPAAGEDTPPEQSEVDFGPIHYEDTIVLQFTPSSYTGDIRLYCDYESGAQGNIWNVTNTGSPLTYIFNQTTPNAGDANDYHACHFFFAANTASTSSGNTQAFQYINNASSSPVTWVYQSGTNGGGIATTLTSTSTTSTSSSTPTSTSTSSPQTTTTTSSSSNSGNNGSTSSPDITAQSQPSSGLSGGAIAGIVIGIVALIAILVGLGFFLGRRHRRNKASGATNGVGGGGGPVVLPPHSSNGGNKGYPQMGEHGASPGSPPPAWSAAAAGGATNGKPGAGYYQPQGQQQQQVRMGELQGNQVSELDNRPVVHEIGDGARMELPA